MDDTAISFALDDMHRGTWTLWVKMLKEERPDLYEYAKKRFERMKEESEKEEREQ